MTNKDAKIDPKDWYVNTYCMGLALITQRQGCLSTDPIVYFCDEAWRRFGGTAQPPESLVAMATVAIRKGSRFDYSYDDEEALVQLTASKQELSAAQRSDFLRLYRSKDQAVVLRIWLEFEYREASAKRGQSPNMPTREYEFISCGRPGVFLGLEELYKFFLSVQLRCDLTCHEFVRDLEFLTSVAEYCGKGADTRGKSEFREEKNRIRKSKKLLRKGSIPRTREIERLLAKTVKTPVDAFGFWVDLSVWWLNRVVIAVRSKDAVMDALYSFYYKSIEAHGDELMDRMLISKCRHCGLYFRYRKGKKYCSPIVEGRDCKKKYWNKVYYDEHKREIQHKSRRYMKDARKFYRDHSLDYDKK
jgi:hypothetical protein